MQETGLPKISPAYDLRMSMTKRNELFTKLKSITNDTVHEGVLAEGQQDPGLGWYSKTGFSPTFADGTSVPDPVEYELPLESLTHEFTSENIPIPLPTDDEEITVGDNPRLTDGSGIGYNRLYQLRNEMLDYGMRTESIIAKGKLTFQRNQLAVPKAPTIYQLFNLVRGSWVLSLEGPGGLENPLNYTLLELDDDIRYRVYISKISRTIEGGIPDVWNYALQMYVLKNENLW